MRYLTDEQIKEILSKCRIFDNARLPKDYDAGVVQGRREIGYVILEILNRDMPDIAEDFVLAEFRAKYPIENKKEEEN